MRNSSFIGKMMNMTKRLKRYVPMLIVLVVFGGLGSALLIYSHAATPVASIEAESGVNSSNAKVVSDASASGGQAVNFGSSNTGGSCAVSTANVPDGSDGMGGCWPGPSNTGPNAPESSMTAYTGSCTVNTANLTIDSKIVNCSPLNVDSGATNLMIKNSYLKGGVIRIGGTSPFTIQDSYIDNARSFPACSGGPFSCAAGLYACGDINNATDDCGVTDSYFIILRTEIVHTIRAAYCANTCTIQDSYFHATNMWPDRTNLSHGSSVRNEHYLTLRHNAIGCDFTAPGNQDPAVINDSIGCSADMSGYPDFAPISHDTIDSNLFLANNVGVGFCAYGGGTAGKPYSNDATNATYIVFQNNVFQRGPNGICGAYGPVIDFKAGRTGNVWTNNKYDNGATVPSN